MKKVVHPRAKTCAYAILCDERLTCFLSKYGCTRTVYFETIFETNTSEFQKVSQNRCEQTLLEHLTSKKAHDWLIEERMTVCKMLLQISNDDSTPITLEMSSTLPS